ncbi:MAG: enolase C-terminal domain-like protein, partial [Pseudomonadota bacterium]
MRITECTLRRVRIPFRQAFSHAAAARHVSDAIIVELKTADGLTGFGEIQARPYVTGEDNDTIWSQHAPRVATQLVNARIDALHDIATLVNDVCDYNEQPACAGGFDIALHDALDLTGRVSWSALFGERTTPARGKCMTIGNDQTGAALIKQARYARLSSCSVVKLKVIDERDIERVLQLREHIGPDIALRLDGNGQMTHTGTKALLAACESAHIESIEEPLARTEKHYVDQLADVHVTTGIDIVADESVCTVRDLDRYSDQRAFQVINVRVGKSGGVTGCAALAKAVLDHGFDIVCGTMVGESEVMLNISRKFLHHCAALDYVEGIDQTR